ncbi:hypothetical protein BGZ73_007378 [Actinomortierella ambigua]|nr:hypothetical protein BGZ73_007378 [Actinomortierella ambigua]
MKFTSIIAFLAVSVATVVALPAADNTPVQLYRRAPCDSQGQQTMNELVRTRNALSNLADEYYRVAYQIPLRPTFERAQADINTIMYEVKDELGDPVRERSQSVTLSRTRDDFNAVSQILSTALSSSGLVHPGSGIERALNDYISLVRSADRRIDDLVYCWKLAGGK